MDVALPEGLRAGGRFAEWAPGVPRYLVADVDGTLIARGTTATPVVAEAVADAHAAGLRVGFATGRLPVGLRDLHGQLRPEGPHVVHNGAQIREGGRALRTWPLECRAAKALVAFCLERRLYAEFYVGEHFVVSDRREVMRPAWAGISGDPDGLVADVDLDATELIKGTVVAFTPDELPDILEGVRRLGLVPEGAPSPLFPGASFVNVNSPEADKGKGLVYAAEHLGVGLDEVVAVGDGSNDLSMLAVAGTAVAMGQADDAIHRAAHVIVPEVEQDGVAHALRAAAQWRRRGLGERGRAEG